jgi:hypothetical protein
MAAASPGAAFTSRSALGDGRDTSKRMYVFQKQDFRFVDISDAGERLLIEQHLGDLLLGPRPDPTHGPGGVERVGEQVGAEPRQLRAGEVEEQGASRARRPVRRCVRRRVRPRRRTPTPP